MYQTIAATIAAVMLAAAPAGTLKVTQRSLVPVCLGTAPVAAGTRSWSTGTVPMTLTFTIANRPRTGIGSATPGHASVTFTPEPGHRYEIEVRAPATAFSSRVFAAGAWAPVVRDRTTDRVVSSPPVWTDGSCAAGASGQH